MKWIALNDNYGNSKEVTIKSLTFTITGKKNQSENHDRKLPSNPNTRRYESFLMYKLIEYFRVRKRKKRTMKKKIKER